MIIEDFKDGDPVPIYRRFRDSGRLMPEGLVYVSSWVDEKMRRCFQLVETKDRELIEIWIKNWSDIVAFQVYPVCSSEQAATKIAPLL